LSIEQAFTQKWGLCPYANFVQDSLDHLERLTSLINDSRSRAYSSTLACSTFEIEHTGAPDSLRITRLVVRPYFLPYRLLEVILMTLFKSCHFFVDPAFVLSIADTPLVQKTMEQYLSAFYFHKGSLYKFGLDSIRAIMPRTLGLQQGSGTFKITF